MLAQPQEDIASQLPNLVEEDYSEIFGMSWSQIGFVFWNCGTRFYFCEVLYRQEVPLEPMFLAPDLLSDGAAMGPIAQDISVEPSVRKSVKKQSTSKAKVSEREKSSQSVNEDSTRAKKSKESLLQEESTAKPVTQPELQDPTSTSVFESNPYVK